MTDGRSDAQGGEPVDPADPADRVESAAPRDALGPEPRDENPLALDDPQQYDDAADLGLDEEPTGHRPTREELATEAAADEAGSGDIATDVALTDREAAANDAAERTRRLQRRDVVRWSARAAAGLAAVGLCGASIVVASGLPEDARAETSAPSSLVHPAAPAQLRVCAGPLLRVGTADGADAQAVAALQAATVETASLGGEVTDEQLALDVAAEVAGGPGVEQRGADATLSAAQSVGIDVEAVRGFAASECAETRLDQWLVGGSTRTGRQSVLVLSNASDVAASIDVTVFGPEGPVSAVGSTGIAVAPGTVDAIDLAALAPGVADAVVRVTSTGAPVAAHLQQTTTRGLERGGLDIVDPVTALTSATLPGVRIAAPSGLEAQPDYDDTVPVLRVLSPEGGDLRLTFSRADGTATESEGALEPGVVTDFPLDELGEGVVAIRVESTSPLVAGARTVAVSAEGIDMDWIAGGQPRSGLSAIAVPPGPSPVLHVVSAARADQEIVVDGAPMALAAGAALELPVSPGSVQIDGQDLVLAIAYRSASEAGGFTVSPQGPAAEGIRVVH